MSQEPLEGHGERFADRDDNRLGDDRRAAESLPFGMAGVTAILERLQGGVEAREQDLEGAWPNSKCRVVAEYILSLGQEYWLSRDELAYCHRVLAR